MPAWLEAALLLPLALLLPGYAIAALLLPRGSVPLVERGVYVGALSIAATILTGIATQLVLGISQAVWVVTLGLLTVAAGAMARRRRRLDPAPGPRLVLRAPRSSLLALPALAAAIAIAAWSIAIAGDGARADRERARFSQLWVLPYGPAAASIGVENDEGRKTSYRLAVSRGGVRVHSWALRLDDGELWQRSVSIPAKPAGDRLLVTLERDGQIYRQAYLKGGPTQ